MICVLYRLKFVLERNKSTRCYCDDEGGAIFSNRIVCDDGSTTNCSKGHSCVGSIFSDPSTMPMDKLCIEGEIIWFFLYFYKGMMAER